MREVDGFVCIGYQKEPYYAWIYGPNRGKGIGTLENFTTNNLTPFSDINEANVGYHALLRRRDLYLTQIAHLEMEIGSTEEEIQVLGQLQGRKWVALQLIPDYREIILYGRFDPQGLQNGYIGTFLESNGLEPFETFESAYRTAREINRQGRSPALVATFSLDIIPVVG